MFLQRLFKPKTDPARQAGEALYAAAAAQARSPAFYAAMGAPDTLEGRFELYTLHVALLVSRLKGQGPAAAGVSQALFDAYVFSLDDALREMGVGDLSVGKKVKKLAAAFYGRLKGVEQAFEAGAADDSLEALLARTLDPDVAPPLAAYLRDARAQLAAQPLDDLLEGAVRWPKA